MTDAEIAAKAAEDAAAAEAAKIAKGPEWANIPEKFHRATLAESVSAMAEGYKAAEKAIHKPSEPVKPLTMTPETPALADDADPLSVLKAAGLDPKAVEETFAKDGKLSDDQYTALAKLGFNKIAVNTVAKSLKATRESDEMKVQQEIAAVYAEHGGSEQVDGLLAWAKGNLPQAEIVRLEAKLSKPGEIQDAVRSIAFSRSQRATTTGSQLVTGGSQNGATGTLKKSDMVTMTSEQNLRTPEGRDAAMKSLTYAAMKDQIKPY